ncbi:MULTISPECIES: hypothetical protein [Amycolatopsis]|uniref:Uncharacterized protein n=1 Tax=Amycolatopsis echigonensis TaxID=2576905 RepID=A0A2N3WMW9_9PSEU|nr:MULTISPECIES: hypothetical protein [Amycolatopsis]MBB2504865.1 hypothetical protein [Amycolatopsis echigonensis]PKV95215.1 hypothetical protein ATK30_6120 [Amycolatopsis niigatensis]
MNTIAGTWLLRMKTPIGTMEATYTFEETDGVLRGSASGFGETTPLTDLEAEGNRFSWRQRITRPMRLNLDYSVVVDGDSLSGESRAGRLPRTSVTGERISA